MPGLRFAKLAMPMFFYGMACVPGEDDSDEPLERVHTVGYIHNGTDEPLRVRVRRLPPSVRIDCAAVASDPGGLLPAKLFSLEFFGVIEVDAVHPLGTDLGSPLADPCTALYLETERAAPVVVFWQNDDLPLVEVPTRGLDPAIPGWIDYTRVDGQLAWQSDPVTTFPVHAVPVPDDPACAPRDDRARSTWTAPTPSGAYRIAAVDVTSDACVAVSLRSFPGGAPRTWFFCGPPDAFPFSEGDHVEFVAQGEVGVEMFLDGESEGVSMYAQRTGAYPFFDFTVTPIPSSCPYHVDGCGTVARTIGVTLESPTWGSVTLDAPSDEPAVFEADDGASLSVYWVRGEERAAVDDECALGLRRPGYDFDLVVVRRPAPR